MKMSEFRRWLLAQGATFEEGAKHTKVYLNGRQCTLPRHAGELGEGLRRAILRQLGLKWWRSAMHYPASIQPDGDGWMVSFPDIPEALTGARTWAQAMELAPDALATALEFYFEDGRSPPEPSRVRDGQVAIEVPAPLAAKVGRVRK